MVAILDIEGDAVRAFDQGQVITLETLADGLGIILSNAELFKALEETNARLVELDRTKSELVNIVAHDFRAPLVHDPGLRGAPGVEARGARQGAEGAGAAHRSRGHPHGRPRWTRP